MSSSKDGTARGLVEFLDYVASKGLMNKNTAASQKSAVVKVLEIDGDGWKDSDLRALDVDHQVGRFQTLKKNDYSPQSLRTYESRFRSALEEYLRFLDDPGAYKPPSSSRESTRTKKPRAATRPSKDGADADSPKQEGGVAPPARDFLITYPFPLREGTMVYLQLPKDLAKKEAERLARFVQSLAFDDAARDEEPPF